MVRANDHVTCLLETRHSMNDILSSYGLNSVSVKNNTKMILDCSTVRRCNGAVMEAADAVLGFDADATFFTRDKVEDTMRQGYIYPTIDQGIGRHFVDDSYPGKTIGLYNSNEQTLARPESVRILHRMAGPTCRNNLHNDMVYNPLPSQHFMKNTIDSDEIEVFYGKEIICPSFEDNEVNDEVDTMNYNMLNYSLASYPVQSGKGLSPTYLSAKPYPDKAFCVYKQDEKIDLRQESIQVCPSYNISEDDSPHQPTPHCEQRTEMGKVTWSSLGDQACPDAGYNWLQMPPQNGVYPYISTNPTSTRVLYQPLIYSGCRNQEGKRNISFSQFSTNDKESKLPYLSHTQQTQNMAKCDEISSAKYRMSFNKRNGIYEVKDTLTTTEHNTMHRHDVLNTSAFQRQQHTVTKIQQDADFSDFGSMTTETSSFADQVDPITYAYAFSTPLLMDKKFTSAESKANQGQMPSVFLSSDYILDGVQCKKSKPGDYPFRDLQASVPILNNFGQDSQIFRNERMAPFDQWQQSDNPVSPKSKYEDCARTFSWLDPNVSVANFRPVNPNLVHNSYISTVSRRFNQVQTQMSFPKGDECPYGISNFSLVNGKSDLSLQRSCSPSIHVEQSSISTSIDSTVMKKNSSARRKQKTYNDNRQRRPKNGFIRFANEKRKEMAKKYPRFNNRQISKLLGNRWKRMSEEDKEPYELSFYEELKKIRDEQPDWKWRNASEPKDINQIMTTRLRPRNKLKVQHSLSAIIGHSAQSSETKQNRSAEYPFRNKDCWVQCDLCLKWRQLPEGFIMQNEIPTFWFCYMNPDSTKSACYVEEELPATNNL